MRALLFGLALTALSLAAFGPPVAAQSFTGTTAGGPTWQRPQTVGTGAPGSCTLSGFATNVPFRVQRIGQNGGIPTSITMTATWTGFDGYLALYRDWFDPAQPCANLVAINDDFGSTAQSQIVRSISPTESYYLVMTGYNNTDAGSYSVAVTGSNALSRPVEWFEGSITNGPTWHRPVNVGNGASGSCQLAPAFANNVRYQAVPLTVSQASGAPHSVFATWRTTNGVFLDGVLALYQGSFNPADPCLNLIRLNDDIPGSGCCSLVTAIMTPGVPYIAVFTGIENSSVGSYGVLFSGEAPLPPVSNEPGTGVPVASLGVPQPNPVAGPATLALTTVVPERVIATVYDALGRHVATLLDATLAPGAHTLTLDAARLAPGTYLVRAEGETFVTTRRVTVAR